MVDEDLVAAITAYQVGRGQGRGGGLRSQLQGEGAAALGPRPRPGHVAARKPRPHCPFATTRPPRRRRRRRPQVGVGRYSDLVRRLLRLHDGYECKEPEPGKFTLAFKRLDACVRWVGAGGAGREGCVWEGGMQGSAVACSCPPSPPPPLRPDYRQRRRCSQRAGLRMPPPPPGTASRPTLLTARRCRAQVVLQPAGGAGADGLARGDPALRGLPPRLGPRRAPGLEGAQGGGRLGALSTLGACLLTSSVPQPRARLSSWRFPSSAVAARGWYTPKRAQTRREQSDGGGEGRRLTPHAAAPAPLLQVRMGMAYGIIASKKPLNTGRADYFGALANTAARVSAISCPGQVLVEVSEVGGGPRALSSAGVGRGQWGGGGAKGPGRAGSGQLRAEVGRRLHAGLALACVCSGLVRPRARQAVAV
jgi:hypothetical protein